MGLSTILQVAIDLKIAEGMQHRKSRIYAATRIILSLPFLVLAGLASPLVNQLGFQWVACIGGLMAGLAMTVSILFKDITGVIVFYGLFSGKLCFNTFLPSTRPGNRPIRAGYPSTPRLKVVGACVRYRKENKFGFICANTMVGVSRFHIKIYCKISHACASFWGLQ